MEKFKKDKIKHDDNSRYKDSKLSIFPLIESIKIYISKSYRNFKADDNRSFTQSYFSDAIKLLLDRYPNASAAYSLRKLSSSYQGPAIRVRRSSDNQEQDIYFDSLSNLDTNSLTSFVGSQNLFLQSEELAFAVWTKRAEAISSVNTNAASSPIGTLTADRINFILQADQDFGIQQVYSSAVAGETYSSAIWLKGEGSNIGKKITIRVKRASGGSYTAVDVSYTLTGEWVKITPSPLTLLPSNTGIIFIISSNEATSVLAWGAQLNTGSSIAAYNPTTTTIAGDGFVTTWYDQSGNSRNATQSTAASQPRIVSAGNIIKENNKPALLFDGANDYLEALAVGSYNSHTFAMVFKRSLGYILSVQYNSPNSIIFWDLQIKYWTAVTTNQVNTSETVNYYNLTFAFKDTSLQSIYINNILKGSIANPVSIGDSSLNMQIGYAIPRNNTLEYLNGTFQEIIYYPINRSSNREELSTNINQYYSIY